MTTAPEAPDTSFEVAAEMIPLDRIHATSNVRSGTLPNIPSLAESIRRDGVLTAITVDRRDDGDYELVAGFRRLAATKLAGLAAIPAVIRERQDEADRLRRQLAENIEREGLRDLDQATAMQQLMDLGVEATAVAETVHTTPDNVQAWAALLKLPPKVRRLIDSGRMTAADAHPLVSLLDDQEAMTAALDLVGSGWDVGGAVRDVTRRFERERAHASARQKLDDEGCRVIDAPQWDQFSSTSKTQKLGKVRGDVQVTVHKHAKLPCHAAFVRRDGGITYVCTDRNQHAGAEGSGVPDLKAERAAKRAATKALRAAHATRFEAVRDAIRAHAIGRDEAIDHILRLAIDDADHRDHGTALRLLGVETTEGRSIHRERDALLAHAAAGPDALLDVALAVAIARGEQSLTSDRFDWRRTTVVEYAKLIRTTGIHEFTAIEDDVITSRTPKQWDPPAVGDQDDDQDGDLDDEVPF